MRSPAFAALAVLLLIGALAAPAAAQELRDPFAPLVRPAAPQAPAVPGGPAPGQPDATTPGPSLPSTGFDPSPYVLAALTLLFIGGALVVLARVRAAA